MNYINETPFIHKDKFNNQYYCDCKFVCATSVEAIEHQHQHARDRIYSLMRNQFIGHEELR